MLDHLTAEPNLRLIMMGLAVLCAVMGFVRGIGRLVLLALALAAGAAAAMAWLRVMPGHAASLWQADPEGFVKWGALVVGLIVTWIARRLLNGIVSGSTPGVLDGRSRMRGGLLGFLPGLALLWCGAVAIRWAGAASYLRHEEEAVDTQSMGPLEDQGLLSRLGKSLSTGVLGDIMNRTDPMSSREALALGTLLVLQRKPPSDAPGKSPVWERTLRHPKTGPVVLLPSFQRLKMDGDVTQALSFSRYSRLLTLAELDAALEDPALREAVLNLDMDSVLRELITGHAAPGIPRAEVVPEPHP